MTSLSDIWGATDKPYVDPRIALLDIVDTWGMSEAIGMGDDDIMTILQTTEEEMDSVMRGAWKEMPISRWHEIVERIKAYQQGDFAP